MLIIYKNKISDINKRINTEYVLTFGFNIMSIHSYIKTYNTKLI